jgi:2-phosphosulfolactate phosphatase
LRAATLVLVLALITAFGGRFEPMENDLRDRGSRPDPQQAPSVHGYFQGEPAAPPWSKAAARVEPLIQRYAIVPTMGSRSTASSTGTVAVVEVFRAFTTAAMALANGAAGIVMVRTIEEALALPDAEIGQIFMGEVRGRAPDGFGFGNSPFEISHIDFGGKTIVQRTSAGTQGIVAAENRAVRLYAASLVTAEATVRALLSGSPDKVSLVAMGENGLKRTDEDELCAIHLRNRLEGRPGDPGPVRRLILAGGEVKRFRYPARPYLHPEDVDIALDIDRYDFAVRVEFEEGRPVARVERPAAVTPKYPT